MTLKRLLVSVETQSLSDENVNECERVTQINKQQQVL